MAYQVLARKYRSRTFDEVVGQAPVAQTLKNAIATGRIHHGYLFTGTRGTGKTSMARILAKALNCLNSPGPTPTPCLECEACRLIAEGQDIDVVEIDAASNTGVDNIRELRSNAAYRPARSRFKIYIIDEVHMLSTGAFNALLKTLEEPPPHVKFILATTELQKVPATIQSRCQRFTFRNIGPEDVAGALAKIVKAEKADAEPAVLERVARLANGSMRDALSLLDQLLSVASGKLTVAVLDEVLPPPQNEQLRALLDHCVGGDAASALRQLDAILSGGRGLEVFCAEFIELLRTLLLIRACGADASGADIPAGAGAAYAALAQQFELSHYVQMISSLEELRRNVRYSGAGRALTEVVVVRFAKLREWTPIERLVAEIGSGSGGGTGGDEKKKFGGSEPQRAVSVAVNAPTRPAVSAPIVVPAAAPVARAAPAPVASSEVEEGPPLWSYEDSDTGSAGDAMPHAHGTPDGAAPAPEAVRPAAARPANAPVVTKVASAAIQETTSAGVSEEDRRKLEADPTVRHMMDLFDAVLVHVDRKSAAPTPTEGVEEAEAG